MRRRLAAGAVLGLAGAAATAQPVVPGGFTARRIAPGLGGSQLAAIDHPQLGTGVMSATASEGVGLFRLVEPTGFIRTIGVWADAPPQGYFVNVRFDNAELISPVIHATYHDSASQDTHYLTIDPDGEVIERWERTDAVEFGFDFSAGNAGNPIGAVLLDRTGTNGTQLAWMNPSYQVTVVDGNSVPPGRTDTDVAGFQRDVTGLYGGGMLLADDDENTDRKSAIYEVRDVLSGGTYRAIYGPVSSNVKRYKSLAIENEGDFGGVIYITETLSDEIQQVAPDGTHTTWATGFTGIDSLSISPDGNSMYVGDLNGVWLIRRSGNEPGPVILTHEPNDAGGSHLTGEPTSFFRIIFNEPISFNDADVTITDGRGEPVAFDASGSGSQFMLIGLGTPLFGDTYTVTIADTVISVATGEALDGDGDGFAGGDAIIDITHRCPADTDGSGEADVNDFFLFLDWFAAGCGG